MSVAEDLQELSERDGAVPRVVTRDAASRSVFGEAKSSSDGWTMFVATFRHRHALTGAPATGLDTPVLEPHV